MALTLSMARSCGACNTLLLLSVIIACNRALGSVVEKSDLERCWILERGIALPLVGVVVAVGVVVSVVVLTSVTTFSPARGVKFTGTFSPPEIIAAESWRVKLLLASMTKI